MNIKDLTRQRFGRLIVLYRNKETKKWICKCSCGTLIEVRTSNLISGNTKSCGCSRKKGLGSKRLLAFWRKIVFLKQEVFWNGQEDFFKYFFNKGYIELLSIKKKKQNVPYKKRNIDVGIYYNKKFYSIDFLKRNDIGTNKRKNSFFIKFKYNNVEIFKGDLYSIEELKNEHIKLYHRYFHKKSFFEE